jgi:dTDP-4-dehydrorhamnose 3,5-epimerase
MSQVSHIDGVMISEITTFSDKRGKFSKFLPSDSLNNSLNSIAISTNFQKGTLRGLHFQIEPFAEEKLITCIQGSIFDVIVDLRPHSSTYGKWVFFELSAKNSMQLYLPKGVAHGYQTIAPDSIIHYCLSSPYARESSFAINPLGDLDIPWPIKKFIISEKDFDCPIRTTYLRFSI